MLRTVEGFHQDEEGDWVAELSCLHGQHVRHKPPLWPRPWVDDPAERDDRIGSELDCPLCDRAELPDGLRVARTAGPFEAGSVPAGLQREHRVADHTWGRLRVDDGSLRFTLAVAPPLDRTMAAGETQAIPPEVPHAVHVIGPVRFVVEFLTRSA